MNEFGVRTWAAIAMIAVALGATWLGGYTFAIFVALVATGVYWEWWSLVRGWSFLWKIGGFFYALVPAVSLLFIRERMPDGLELVLWVFFVTWGADIGGYVAGKNIGGPKLAPSLSPKKTWAGLLGAMVMAGVLGALWADLHNLDAKLFWLGAPLALAAQIGDLFESGMKRRAGVKDSGTLLPGHGGLFDRVDGLIIVATLVAMMLLWNWI